MKSKTTLEGSTSALFTARVATVLGFWIFAYNFSTAIYRIENGAPISDVDDAFKYALSGVGLVAAGGLVRSHISFQRLVLEQLSKSYMQQLSQIKRKPTPEYKTTQGPAQIIAQPEPSENKVAVGEEVPEEIPEEIPEEAGDIKFSGPEKMAFAFSNLANSFSFSSGKKTKTPPAPTDLAPPLIDTEPETVVINYKDSGEDPLYKPCHSCGKIILRKVSTCINCGSTQILST
ncbi:MAG: hypothetical protein HOI21_11365 [Bacteroidetes Order II. Incertae sedis bacterium]|nr:hypothetical protein [Bacteroidetes Order II. bacterium]